MESDRYNYEVVIDRKGQTQNGSRWMNRSHVVVDSEGKLINGYSFVGSRKIDGEPMVPFQTYLGVGIAMREYENAIKYIKEKMDIIAKS